MASSSDPLHFSSASNAPPPASSRSLGLQRPPSSHSALAPERAPEPEGLHVTEHERALSGRANSRAGTGAIAVKGPRKPLFDRFYDRRRGRPTVVAGAAGSNDDGMDEKLEPDVRYSGISGTYDFDASERKRRLKKVAVGAAVVIVVLAIALGVGLGVGLKKRSPQPTPTPSAANTPTSSPSPTSSPPTPTPTNRDPSPHCPQDNGTTITSEGNQQFLQLCNTDYKNGLPSARKRDLTLTQRQSAPGSSSGIQDLPAGPEGDADHTAGLVRYTFRDCVLACAMWNIEHKVNGTRASSTSRLRSRQTQNGDENEPDEDESPNPATSTAGGFLGFPTAASSAASSSRASSAASSSTAASSSASATASAGLKCYAVTYVGNITWVNEGAAQGKGQNRNCYLKSGVPADGGQTYGIHDDTASARLLGE